MTRTVLILAHQCHPFERRESAMGAQRAYQFAKWLPEFGWRAEVLCCPVLVEQVEPLAVGESVVRPVPPAEDAGLLDRWWRTLASSSSPLASLPRRGLTAALLPKGDWSRTWRAPAFKVALDRIEAGRRGELPPIDVVIGEHGPDAGLWAARDVARVSGLPWVVDFRDSILATWPAGLARQVASAGVRRMLRGVRATINVNPYWVEIDESLSGALGYLIPNGYDPDATPPAAARRDRFTVVVYGSLRSSHRLDMLSDCLARLKATHGVTADNFEMVYFGLHGQKMDTEARARNVSDLLRAAGFVPRPELLATVAAAHAVVVPTIDPSIEREPLFSRGVVHGKMPELLPLGTPLVFVPGDGGYADELLARTNAGVVARTTDDLVDVLAKWLSRWRTGLTFGPVPVPVEIERFSRREGARALAEILGRIVAGDLGSTRSSAGGKPFAS